MNESGQAGVTSDVLEASPAMVDALVRVIDEEMESDGFLGRVGLRELATRALSAALSVAHLQSGRLADDR